MVERGVARVRDHPRRPPRFPARWWMVARGAYSVPAGTGFTSRGLAAPGRLTDAERRAIQALAASRSLRDLAADFGVSHETVRAVLRDREAA